MIRIHILRGSEKGRRLDFNKDIIYVGRSKDNDIQMNNLTVSRNHLKIMNKRGRYFIEDLNSTNGTLLNNERITKAGLSGKDVISIGKHTLFVSVLEGREATQGISESTIKINP